MANSGTNCKVESAPIDGVEITSDNLTSRAGLALFSRYLSALGVLSDIKRLFGSMRKSRKGLSVPRLFKQLLCFFSRRHQPAHGAIRPLEGGSRLRECD